MSDLRLYIKSLFKYYDIGPNFFFIFDELELLFNQKIKESDLVDDIVSYDQVFQSLGSKEYLKTNYIFKYDLVRFSKHSRIVLYGNLIVSIFYIFIVGITTLLQFMWYTISIFANSGMELSDVINYEDFGYMLTAIKIFLVVVFGIALLITDKKCKTNTNLIISLLIGIITLPLGFMILLYALIKLIYSYQFYINKRILYIIIPILLGTGILITLYIIQNTLIV
jgi:hypothetical protein